MVILIQCTDRVGLVAAIAGVMAGEQINIVSMREHVDIAANIFFTRLVTDNLHIKAEILHTKLQQVLPHDAAITVNPDPDKKVAVLVTKEYHCLGDILLRNHFKTLRATVSVVIGNHKDLENICARFNIPFHFISHINKPKEIFEGEIMECIYNCKPDYIVLAKFMQILSPGFVEKFKSRVINIHHSFLPAFTGASPYRQAFERGVKLIGATAHFITNELDEGPIIAQQIIPVNHSYTPADMVKAGKEIETAVLAKALQLVFDDRVFIYRNKTIVFE